MNKVKISIVIPIYNVEKYLPQCLDSVINQSYENIEIILVDDGSPDNSRSICDEYLNKDKRIKVYHQKNGGVSQARNNGINVSSGKYVTFIDSDDVVHPDYIKKLVDNLAEDVLSICQIEKFQGKAIFKINSDITKKELDKNHFIELCEMSLFNTPCCKLYNLEIIKKNKVSFKEKLSLGEDLLFNIDYLKYIEKIVVTTEKLYYYRRSETNTLSMSYYPKMLDIQLMLFDKYTKFFDNTSMDMSALKIFDTYRFNIIMVIVANEFANGNVGLLKRCLNVKKILKTDELKSILKEIRFCKEKFNYFLISHRLILTYRICDKIKRTI